MLSVVSSDVCAILDFEDTLIFVKSSRSDSYLPMLG